MVLSTKVVNCLKDLLTAMFYRKEDLRRFLEDTVSDQQLLEGVDWSGLKKHTVDHVVDAMAKAPDPKPLVLLLQSVQSVTEFPGLVGYDSNGRLETQARVALARLCLALS